MEAIKFTLSGRNAFFKKPEVNAVHYYTYGQIHKVALLGMFGAILGYNGYAQKEWKAAKKGQEIPEEYPEFYEKLQDLKIAVVPGNKKGYIQKKLQVFNNSVGYASGETGGNLIVKEQWLENPTWQIYVLLDTEAARELTEFLELKKCIYIPYLGKNDHPADITNVEKVMLKQGKNGIYRIDSLFLKKNGDICLWDNEDDDEEEETDTYKYEEKLPTAINGWTNLYEYETFCYTNMPVDIKDGVLYQENNRILMFY